MFGARIKIMWEEQLCSELVEYKYFNLIMHADKGTAINCYHKVQSIKAIKDIILIH